ncbi:MAG: NusG domain II-containing protein [Acetanaerobacterium sp.]
MPNERRFFQKSDLLIIVGILVLTGLLALWAGAALRTDSAVAQIYVDGALWREIELSKVEQTEIIDIDAALHVRIEVSPGSIRFLESECRDKICVKTGALTQPPDYAACLPARVAIKITAKGSPPPLDAIAG